MDDAMLVGRTKLSHYGQVFGVTGCYKIAPQLAARGFLHLHTKALFSLKTKNVYLLRRQLTQAGGGGGARLNF